MVAAHKRFWLSWFCSRLGTDSGAVLVALVLLWPSGRAQGRTDLEVASAAPPLATALTLPPPTQQTQAQQPAEGQFVIARIDFVGNRRIRTDTLRARIFSRNGDPYSEEALRRDFQALWNTQFFEDIQLRVEDSPTNPRGKIIVFEVKERPIIRRIRYDGLKSVTESDVLDRFKDRKVGLTVESQFDPTRIKKAQVVIQELLAERGRQFAKVTPEYERIAASNAVILIFKVQEGPKVKVGRIRFTGNHAFSSRRIIRSMKHTHPYAIPMYLFDINVLSKTFDRSKLDEDLEVGVRGLYQDNGYFRVVVKDPIIETVDVQHGLPFPGLAHKSGKVTNITIPIEEGPRYRMGTLRIVSADPEKGLSLKVDTLKAMFPLKEGDIFSAGKVRKAFENYKNLYGQFGFIDFTSEPVTDIDEADKRINLTLKFNEQKMYYVRRINFSGNTTTRDKVIRREILLDEGQLFNQRAWEVSILRLNQLGYFEKIKKEDAEIKRNAKESSVDIDLKLKEKGKQSISLQGGVSGLVGSFAGLTYQTNNFLGLGETLTVSAQLGTIQSSTMFGFTEPYLFDRPISTGFTVFYSKYSYNQAQQYSLLLQTPISLPGTLVQDYTQNSAGFTVFASYPLRRFSFTRLGLTYGLTRTSIVPFSQASQLLFSEVQYRSIIGPSAYSGILESRITPTITYNTVDNPLNPTHGRSIFYSLSVEGGALGGDVNSISNTLEWKYFHPVNKRRHVLGVRLQAAHIMSFGGLGLLPTSRFYAGGEDSIRGFDIRAITPVIFIPVKNTFSFTDPKDNIPRTVDYLTYNSVLPGGDLQGVGNLEYRIPLAGQTVGMTLFADVGAVGILNTNDLRLPAATLTSLQTEFPTDNIPSRADILKASNFALHTSTGVEFVVQIPIIQAPFRFYFALNPDRFHQTLVPPPGDWAKNDPNLLWIKNNDPEYYQDWLLPTLTNLTRNPGQGTLLHYFEAAHVFRFTVGRTF
jgi:outer membrane protein insertion porin family